MLLYLLVSCTSVDNKIDESKTITKIDINEIASEKFGEQFSLDYNLSKEFVICRKQTKSKLAGNNPIQYFIYDVDKNKIIEEKIIPLGNVLWVSEFEVRVEIHPGMIQKNVESNNGYILNVKTNLKTKFNGGVH